MLAHMVTQVQVPARVLCTSRIQKLFVIVSLHAYVYWKVRRQKSSNAAFIYHS
jgi:hypothetical protein